MFTHMVHGRKATLHRISDIVVQLENWPTHP